MVDEVKDADTLTTAVPADLRLWGHLARPGGAQVLVSTAAISATIEADLAPTVGSSAAAAASSALSAANSATATAADHVSTTASASAAAASAAEAAAYLNGTAALTGTLPRVSRTALKALDTDTITTAWVTESGREGMFHFRSGNYSTQIAADTCEGIYIKATAVASSSGAWVRAYDGAVMVSWFGATGDGSTDDTTALQCAITVGGAGAVIMLDQGATYILSAGLVLLSRQKLTGGGTLKRRAQITTTTTTPMTVGVTNSVTVNDASGFRVGHSVAFAAAGVARSALLIDSTMSYDRKITAIVGNTLTFNTAPTCNLPIGSTLFSAFPTLALGAGSLAENLIIDGNRANHSYCRWEVHGEIYLQGAGAVVRDSQITEAPSEGIWVYADNVLAEHCKLTNIGGNGAHFSACTNAQVVSCRMTDGNLDTDTGHRDGGIAWSLQVKDAVVRDNHITNFIDGIGGMNAAVSSHALIKGNTVRACRRYGIAVGGDITDLAFVDNRVYDCNVAAADGGLSILNGLGSNIRFSGNEFIGCNASINIGAASAGRWLFEGNTIVGNLVLFGLKGQFARNTVKGQTRVGACDQAVVNDNLFDRSGVTNDPAVDIYWGSNVGLTIANNKIIGGNRGIYCATSATNLMILNNTCLDQYDKAIFFEDTFERFGLLIQANMCRNLAAAPSWVGIDVRCPKASIVGNDVMPQAGSSASIGIVLASGTCAGTLVKGNTVRGTWVNGSIVLDASTAGAIVRRNDVSSAVVDSGTGNTLADNQAV